MIFPRDEEQMVVVDPLEDGVYDAPFFEKCMSTLKSEVLGSIPGMPASFQEACKAVEEAHASQKDSEKNHDQLSKKPPTENKEEILAQAKERVTEMTENLKKATESFQTAASALFDQGDVQSFLGDSFDDKSLMTLFVMQQQTGKQWADWWSLSSTDLQQQLLAFLQHENDLLKRFLEAGGARHGAYPRAIEIYCELCRLVCEQDSSYQSVLDRLAMAVALELCDPICYFDSKTDRIDPIPRYKHYQDAFLHGQLDPAFEFFTAWELRHVVNSDAQNEELAWGRESLKNFRPGLVYLRNPKWRYCRIVKTDIPHKTPDWYKQPRSYDQILSGGGKCGPRAWYGRFICKAFGLPTWGAKQPGHAAMSRWTPDGWTTCLGAAFRWNSWEGRCGLDFQLETQVRQIFSNNEEDYRRQVSRLEYISALYQEDARSVVGKLVPSAKCPWYSLALARRQRIVEGNPGGGKKPDPVPSLSRNNEIQTVLEAPLNRGSVTRADDGTILVSAAATSQPKNETRVIFFPQSFLEGGQQLLMPANSTVEYTIRSEILGDQPQKYCMTCRFCTVHRNETPLILKLKVDGQDQGEPVEVPLAYTMGMWQETEPVIMDFSQKVATTTILVVTRPRKEYAIGIKDFRFVPV